MPTAELAPDGGRVAYAVTGEGPALLLVPGWLSHLELGWAIPVERRFHQALSSGRTLVRYDRPGCGLSDAYDGPRTMELELDTISAVVEALGLTSFDVLGTSLGGPVAALWAAERPETVSRLVLYGGWATVGRSATRTAGGTCSGWSAPTGAWVRTCSPSSTRPTRTRPPAGGSRRTSAPPRPRRRRRPSCGWPSSWT